MNAWWISLLIFILGFISGFVLAGKMFGQSMNKLIENRRTALLEKINKV